MRMKVPINLGKLPVEARIKIYDLSDISCISPEDKLPWARAILMSGILDDKDAIEIAAIQGDETRRSMCSYIALSGNLPMMKWARSGAAVPRKDDAVLTERSANLVPCSRAGKTDYNPSDKSSTKDEAAEEQSVEQIRVTPFPWNAETCHNAAKLGHFQLLKWLHEQGCPWNHRTFDAAAAFGDLEMLEWLYQEKCPWDRFTCYMAGNFDVLKWLHERNCPWDSSCYESAIRSGNFDIVVRLHEQGCPWNEAVCAEAAEGGHLEILQWLHEQGCPWDENTFARAARGGHLVILSYVHEEECPWDSETLDSFRAWDDVYDWAESKGYFRKDSDSQEEEIEGGYDMDNIEDEGPYLPFVDNTEDDDVDNVTDEDEEPSDNSEDYY